MSVVSYLADSPSVCEFGEFTYRDIINGQYSFEVDFPSPYNILVVGKGPNQDSRTSTGDDIDVIIIGAMISRSNYLVSNGIVCQSPLSGENPRNYIKLHGMNIYPFTYTKNGSKTKITIEFSKSYGLQHLDYSGYSFKYFIAAEPIHNPTTYSDAKMNYRPSNDIKTNFEYEIVNKLSHPQQRPMEVRAIKTTTLYDGPFTYTNFNGSTSGMYDNQLSDYDYYFDSGSVLFGCIVGTDYGYYDTGIVVSWPNWLTPITDNKSDGIHTYTAYWFGDNSNNPYPSKLVGEFVTLTDSQSNGTRTSLEVRIENGKTTSKSGNVNSEWFFVSNAEEGNS